MKTYTLKLTKKYSRPSYGDTTLLADYNLIHFKNGFYNEYTLTFEIQVSDNCEDVYMNLVGDYNLNDYSNQETLTQEGVEILLEL